MAGRLPGGRNGAVTAEVISFPGDTTLPVPVKTVLEGVAEADLEEIFVLGYKDGKLNGWASTSDVAALILMFERWKHKVLTGAYG